MGDYDYDSLVKKISGITTVNLTTAGAQWSSEMLAMPDGTSRIFYWSSGGQILGRTISADGTPVGAEATIVSSGVTDYEKSAVVLSNGNIVIAYQVGADIKASIFSPTLQQIGSPVTLFHNSTGKVFSQVKLASTADGFAAVAKLNFQVINSPYDKDIYISTFSSSGLELKHASITVVSDDSAPDIAVLNNGNIAVSFHRYVSSSDTNHVYMGIYTPNTTSTVLGVVRAPESVGVDDSKDAFIRALPDGTFVLAYSEKSGGYYYPHHQVRNAAGDVLDDAGGGNGGNIIEDTAVNQATGYTASYSTLGSDHPAITVAYWSTEKPGQLRTSTFFLIDPPNNSVSERDGQVTWVNPYTVQVSWETSDSTANDGSSYGVTVARYELIEKYSSSDDPDSFVGNELLQQYRTRGGDDVIDGRGGPDTMMGGKGNDTYFVDNFGDVVDEVADNADGWDTVKAWIGGYTLPANVEALVLLGTASISGFGNSLNNSLVGNSGDNWLDGVFGADTMHGGDGNDSYVVNSKDDFVDEFTSGSGWDTVYSSINYKLGPNLDALVLTGDLKLDGKGNGLSNSILGNVAANDLSGGGGNDTIKGGGGKDTIDGGGGSDTADYSDKTKALSISLDGSHSVSVKVKGKVEDTLKNVENLIGGTKADTFIGDSKANTFDGGLGKDVFTGKGGNDNFVFSTALGPSNADTITDFSHKHDKLVLTAAQVGWFLGSAVEKAEFYAKAGATKAHDANDRIIYNKTNGDLYFDYDGKGGAKAILFAHIDNHPSSFDHHDFLIV